MGVALVLERQERFAQPPGGAASPALSAPWIAVDRCGAMVTEPEVKACKPNFVQWTMAGRSPMPADQTLGAARLG